MNTEGMWRNGNEEDHVDNATLAGIVAKNYVADFYTYIQGKDEIIELLNRILACHYEETTDKDELFLYFKVIREYSQKQEIKRLTNLMKKEIDPIEQAKISEKIRKLRLGDN